ncbi:NlpC/P60 family protein, partial [Fulvivirga sp. RKSG066]|uniref:C40 family peptidase n=1 Tax=Fulvivirga aurantia TaxID=2529383 RepID=UPI0012BB94F3
YKICTDLTSSILYKKHHIHIVIGSVLPISTNEIFKVEEQLAFNGEAKSLSQKREFEFLKELACKYINSPYLWGGRSPFGIDCSGFSQNVFRMSGYSLPRDARQQISHGEVIASLQDSEPGDLAFFNNSNGAINHVGIVFPENKIIHASGRVRVDDLTEGGIIDHESGQQTHQLTAIKRILKN